MSKKKYNDALPIGEVSWGYGLVVEEDLPNRIVGNVLTLLELLGLPEKQERPFKELVTQRVWECFNNNGVTIGRETHDKIREAHYAEKDRARGVGLPPSAVNI